MSVNDATTVHLVPHFHYDTVYLKTYEQYLETALRHIHEALRIMTVSEEYTFMIEQTILLEEYWERFPEQRTLLKHLAAEGRLEVACGMYCMPDVNIPSGESFIQQVVRGKRWVKEYLGIEVKVAWISDSFGHHPQLPQLLQHCGYNSYVFARGMDPLAITPFLWKGIDGTEIFTHRLHGGYGLILFSREVENALELNLNVTKGADAIFERIALLETVSAGNGQLLLPNGGDLAKPQQAAIAAVEDYNRRRGAGPTCKFSTVHEYVSASNESQHDLSVAAEDFNPVTPGIYSSRMAIKKWNRYLECKLQMVERWQAVSSFTSGTPSCAMPRSYWIDAARDQILYNQFHDIISGTIVDPGYKDCLRRYMEADADLNRAISSLKEQMVIGEQPSTNSLGSLQNIQLMVFNPSGFEREEVVCFRIEMSRTDVTGVKLLTDEGQELESQFRVVGADPYGTRTAEIVFSDSWKGLSRKIYQVNWLFASDHTVSLSHKKDDGEYRLEKVKEGYSFENKHCQIRIASNGCITGYRSKQTDREWVPEKEGWNDIWFLSDTGDLWLYSDPIINGAFYGPMNDVFAEMIQEEKPYVRKNLGRTLRTRGTLTVKEEDPHHVILVSKGTLQFWKMRVEYEKTIKLFKKSGKIGFETKLTGTGKQYRLVAAFPTSMENGEFYQEIPFGTVVRGTGEFPAQNWSLLEEDHRGVVLTNSGIPGNGRLGGLLYLALTRSVSMSYKTESDLAYEEGVCHTYRYEIEPYENASHLDLKPWRSGEQLNLALQTAIFPAGVELLPLEGIEIEGDSLQLSGFYEQGDKWVLRIYEASGTTVNGVLRFASVSTSKLPLAYWEENALGVPLTEPQSFAGTIEVEMTPYQIKTFAIGKPGILL